MNRLPAGTGWLWLTQGFALFRKQPGLLTSLLLANVMFTLLMLSLQVVGVLLYALLTPSINMILFEASRRIADGERLTPAVLATGFRRDAFGALVKLGGVYLGVIVVIVLIAMLVVPQADQTALADAIKAAQKSGKPMEFPDSVKSFMVIMACLSSAVALSLAFAPPLITWKKMPTFKAVFYSVFAVFGSLGPVLVMLACWAMIYMTLMTVAGAVFGKSLGVLVLMSFHLVMTAVFQCALFAAYRQLIPDAGPPAA